MLLASFALPIALTYPWSATLLRAVLLHTEHTPFVNSEVAGRGAVLLKHGRRCRFPQARFTLLSAERTTNLF